MKTTLRVMLIAFVAILASCASAPKNPVLGSWDVSIASPVGELPGVFMFAADGAGSMAIQVPGAGDQPPAAFSGAVYDGNNVSFSADIAAQGQSVTLKFSGMVEGDALSGTMDSSFGAFPVKGMRKL